MDVRRIVEEGLAKEVNPAPADRYYAGFMPTGMFAASPEIGDTDDCLARISEMPHSCSNRTWCSRVTISSMWERPLETLFGAAGLYSRDTRHLNGIQILLNGRVPEMLAVNTHHASAATIVSANPALSLNGDDNLLLPHQVAIEQRLSLDTRLHTHVLQNYSTLSLPLRFGLFPLISMTSSKCGVTNGRSGERCCGRMRTREPFASDIARATTQSSKR